MGGLTVDMIGPIHGDIFLQDKYFLDGVHGKLKFIQSSDALCLIAARGDATFKVKIIDASMSIRRVQASSALMQGHVKALD